MFCSNCGCELKKGAKFCSKCGAQILSPGENQEERPVQTESGAPCADYDTAETSDAEPAVSDPVIVSEQPKKKKKILAAVIIVILAAAVAAVIIFVWNGGESEKQFQNHMKAGQTYLEEKAYEEAVDEFEAAIEIQPDAVEPYRLMAQAYIGLDDSENVEVIYDTIRGIIVEDYQSSEENELLEDSKELYVDAINFYGEQEDANTVEELAEEIVLMLTDEEDVEEIEELEEHWLLLIEGEETEEDDLSENTDETVASDQDLAYYNKILEYQELYGEAEVLMTEEENYYLSGLCLVREYNFDPNDSGNMDLLLAYVEPDNYMGNINKTMAALLGKSRADLLPKYTVEVWSYQNNELVNVFNGTGYIDQGGTTDLCVQDIDGVSYLVEGEGYFVSTTKTISGGEVVSTAGGGVQAEYYIWGYGADSFVLEDTIINTLESTGENTYTLNGSVITEAEFEQWSNSIVHHVLSSSSDAYWESRLSGLSTMIEIYREKLGIENE